MHGNERRLQVAIEAGEPWKARLDDIDLGERLPGGYAAPQTEDSAVVEITHKPRSLLRTEHKRTKDIEPRVRGAGKREPERRRKNADHLAILAVNQNRLA